MFSMGVHHLLGHGRKAANWVMMGAASAAVTVSRIPVHTTGSP